MHHIETWSSLLAALVSCPAAARLRPHAERLREFEDQPLNTLCEFLIVEPPDRLRNLEAVVGRPLHPPPWEYVELIDGWYELVLINSDDGFGYVVLVPEQAAIDPDLLTYCRAMMT